ncbi:hypothetical protein [Kribbella sp.]|uniref:hypothetical protein n=1 Tax=Kribbella sp. TaxID=1871183 RepID=UPI002D57BC35|nr:hypothetical protein [Kribbella sp.]HZX03891.1 hypothetical protein [Kribbella sp.]
MGQRWDMGQETLGQLTKKTSTGTQDLGGLVKQLVAAAQPLEGKMNGAGKGAFDAFKANVDSIAADLNAGMGRITEGQAGMDTAFRTGDSDMAQTAKKNEGAADFDGARFGKR